MIGRRGSKFFATIHNPHTGKKQWVGTFATEAEAKDAEARAWLERKKAPVERGETCDQFAARWLRDYPRQRASTNLSYTERVAKFAEDFAGIPLEDITRIAAKRWALEHPSRHKAVRAMFSDAVNEGVVAANPFLNMRLPASRGRKDDFIPSMDDVARIAEKAYELRGPIFKAFVLTAAYGGLRPGEMYALRWPQVDLEADRIHVIESYSSKSGETTKPKTLAGVRTIALHPKALAALLAIHRPDGFVFATVTGKRLTGRTIHYQWDAVRVAAGFPGLDLYALRHACASHLLNDLGLPAHQVAAHLGHDDGGVLVMKLYGHPSKALALDAIAAAYAPNVVPIKDRRASGA